MALVGDTVSPVRPDQASMELKAADCMRVTRTSGE